MMAFSLQKQTPDRRPGCPERRQDDRLLLQLLGVTLSRQGPLLLQEDEGDGGNEVGQVKKSQELHAACC